MNSTMLLDFDSLKTLDDSDNKLKLLKELKNDLVGCSDTKKAYFDAGLLETLIPLGAGLSKDIKDQNISFEILAIVNCFFFEVPAAKECFIIHKEHLAKIINQIFEDRLKEDATQNKEL